jgi:hypothetical protein
VSTELVPLLQLQVVPPGIQQAVMHLSKLDRTPLHRHSSSQQTLEGDYVTGKLQTAVVVPAKKKRGRPAKISHKVDEGKNNHTLQILVHFLIFCMLRLKYAREFVTSSLERFYIVFATFGWKHEPLYHMFLSTYKTFLSLSFCTQGMMYLQRCFYFLLGLLFDREDGGSMFLRNVVERIPDYVALRSRR